MKRRCRFLVEDPPQFFEIPFSLHDGDQLLAMMRESGFAEPRVRRLDLPSVSSSAVEAALGLVQGTPLFVALNERQADVSVITKAVAEALAVEFGDDPIRGRMRALVCEATR